MAVDYGKDKYLSYQFKFTDPNGVSKGVPRVETVTGTGTSEEAARNDAVNRTSHGWSIIDEPATLLGQKVETRTKDGGTRSTTYDIVPVDETAGRRSVDLRTPQEVAAEKQKAAAIKAGTIPNPLTDNNTSRNSQGNTPSNTPDGKKPYAEALAALQANFQGDALARAKESLDAAYGNGGNTNAPNKDQPNGGGAPAQPTADLTGLPSGSLQPGQSGPEVKALQDWLIRNGYNIPDGATGYYGSQTKAAVAALQQKLGVDPGQYPGYFGPITKTALAGGSGGSSVSQGQGTQGPGTNPGDVEGASTEDQGPGESPTSSFIKTYQDISDQLGLSDLKDEAAKYTKEAQDLENEMNDKVADVNENPWYDEGTRQKEVERVKERYATKLETLSNYQQLYESLYEQGISEAKFITTGEVDDRNRMLELAQKQIDAANKLDTQVVEVNGQKVLINSKTGDVIRSLGSSKAPGSGSDRYTQTQRNVGAANAGMPLKDFDTLDEDDQNYFINGYGTFKTLLSDYQKGKVNEDEFRQAIDDADGISGTVKTMLYEKAGLSPDVAGANTGGFDLGNFLGGSWDVIAHTLGL